MESKRTPEADGKKPGFFKKLQNKLLSICGCGQAALHDDEIDHARLTQAYLLKKEKKRSNNLRKKLDQEYFQSNLQAYRDALGKIISPKMSSEEWQEMQAQDPPSFVVSLVKKLRENQLPLTEKEKSRVIHYLGLIRQIIGLKVEMKNSLSVEPYYQMVSAVANYQQMFGFLYVLIENLHHLVDEKIEIQTTSYLRKQLKGVANAEQMNLSELREAFETLDERAKEAILGAHMDLFLRDLFGDLGLKVATEVKTWARDNLQRFDGAAVEQPVKDQERAHASPATVDSLQMSDIYEITSKFEKLQQKLEPAHLRENVIAYIRSSKF
jgi:hypothetical protein